MQEEMESLQKNNRWTLVPKPKDQKVIAYKWIYKVKDGLTKEEPKKLKARLVTKGFTKHKQIDYTEIFSLVANYKTIRIKSSLVAHKNWELDQLDVRTTFCMGTWMRLYICNNQRKILKQQGNNIWFV